MSLTRRPIAWVEIDLERCTRTYGTAPCTAAVGTTGRDRCYNTLRTCQAPTAYASAAKTWRFVMTGQALPGPVVAGLGAIPSVTKIAQDPSRIDPKRGLGVRSRLTVTLRDHPHHDLTADPYAALRAAPAGGTFWGRLLTRSPYVEGRPCRLCVAELDDAGAIDLGSIRTQHYLITQIDGPGSNGTVTITAKDLLTLAEDDRAQVPARTTGELSAAILAADTAAALRADTAAELAAYPAGGGLVRIEDELIAYAARGSITAVPETSTATGYYTATLTGLSRAQHGSEAADHDDRTAVQLARVFAGLRADEALGELLDAAGVPTAYQDRAAWAAEVDTWMSGVQVGRVISDPTGVRALVAELCASVGIYAWWDTRAQTVRMRALRPPLDEETRTITDREHLVAGSVSTERDRDERVSQVRVYLDQINATTTGDEPRQFRRSYVAADLDASSAEQYGTEAIAEVFALWLPASQQDHARDLAMRTLLAYRDPPLSIKASVSANDADLWAGSTVAVLSRAIQGADGQPLATAAVITEAKDGLEGAPAALVLQATSLPTRVARFTDDAVGDYLAATDTERRRGGWLADDGDPALVSGDPAYLFI